MNEHWARIVKDVDGFRVATQATLVDVARLAGLAPSTLLRGFNRSNMHPPSPSTIRAIYRAIGQPIPEELPKESNAPVFAIREAADGDVTVLTIEVRIKKAA